MMTLDQHMADTPAREGSLFASIWLRVADWLRTCARCHAAAGTYELLSGLSDAELHRRGLSRETLGRDVFDAFDRSNKG